MSSADGTNAALLQQSSVEDQLQTLSKFAVPDSPVPSEISLLKLATDLAVLQKVSSEGIGEFNAALFAQSQVQEKASLSPSSSAKPDTTQQEIALLCCLHSFLTRMQRLILASTWMTTQILQQKTGVSLILAKCDPLSVQRRKSLPTGMLDLTPDMTRRRSSCSNKGGRGVHAPDIDLISPLNSPRALNGKPNGRAQVHVEPSAEEPIPEGDENGTRRSDNRSVQIRNRSKGRVEFKREMVEASPSSKSGPQLTVPQTGVGFRDDASVIGEDEKQEVKEVEDKDKIRRARKPTGFINFHFDADDGDEESDCSPGSKRHAVAQASLEAVAAVAKAAGVPPPSCIFSAGPRQSPISVDVERSTTVSAPWKKTTRIEEPSKAESSKASASSPSDESAPRLVGSHGFPKLLKRGSSVEFSANEEIHDKFEDPNFDNPERRERRSSLVRNRLPTGFVKLSEEEMMQLSQQYEEARQAEEEAAADEESCSDTVEGGGRRTSVSVVVSALKPTEIGSPPIAGRGQGDDGFLAVEVEEGRRDSFWKEERRQERHERISKRKATGKFTYDELSLEQLEELGREAEERDALLNEAINRKRQSLKSCASSNATDATDSTEQ